MSELVFDREALFAEHDYVSVCEENGQRMHGGFLADGSYAPPRSAIRYEAIRAWSDALRRRGGDLLAADASLLGGPRVPNVAQQALLIREGLGQTFWNSLTITGKIEARGKVLAEIEFPDLQKVVVEDISEMAIGHLNKGLLAAHGLDEGGLPEDGIGGHDVMWYVARDLAFGSVDYPDVEPPESISRPESGERVMPEIAAEYEGLLSFLMNLLIIEFRAEIGFANTQTLLRDPGLFTGRRAQAELAAEIVERIRTDEEIHVESLRLYLGELRSVSLRTVDGATISGATLIDRFWDGLVQWATVEQPRLASLQQHEQIKPRILEHPQGDRVLAEFEAASDLTPDQLAAAG